MLNVRAANQYDLSPSALEPHDAVPLRRKRMMQIGHASKTAISTAAWAAPLQAVYELLVDLQLDKLPALKMRAKVVPCTDTQDSLAAPAPRVAAGGGI